MGELTFDQLRTEIFRNLQERSETWNSIESWINLSQTRIARAHRWEELMRLYTFTLNVGVDTVAQRYQDRVVVLPFGTIRDVYSLRIITSDGRSEVIELVPASQFDMFAPEPEYHDRRKPTMAALYGKYMELDRAPDEAYTLRARFDVWPASLSSDTPDGKSDLDRKDDIIIQLATSFGWQGIDREKSNHAFSVASSMLQEAVKEQTEKPAREIAPSFEQGRDMRGQYWKDPFVRGV